MALRNSTIKTFYRHGLLLSKPKGYLISVDECIINSTSLSQQSKFFGTKKSILPSKYKTIIGLSLGVGVFASGGYLYRQYTKVNNPNMEFASINEYFLQEPHPEQKISRSIRNSADKSGFKITLYQFQTCPFCCKVRAYLDYFGFSYDVVEVNSVTHKQAKWSTYKKVPFLVIEQNGVEEAMILKDSSMIISALHSYIVNTKDTLEEIVKAYPTVFYEDTDGKKKSMITNRHSLMYGDSVPESSEESIKLDKKWRKWVDDVYVHMLSPNVYRTMNESFQAFNWFSEVGKWEELFERWERLLVINLGSVAMFLIGKRLKKRYNLHDDVRTSLYQETDLWLKEVRSHGKFLGGNEPNLSDLGVYGVLNAIEGCNAFQDLMGNTKVKSWFMLMKESVENHDGVKYLNARGPNRV